MRDSVAATWIKPIHQQLQKTVDYVTDPSKTHNGELVTSYECTTESTVDEFTLTKDDYHNLTGRSQGANEILAYHVRQAFKPDEIDADTANKLGHVLAMELTGGNNAYIVATHVDKPHWIEIRH